MLACSSPSAATFPTEGMVYLKLPPPPGSTLFPYTTLFRSWTRKTFERVFKASEGSLDMDLVYDVEAALARSEEHTSELQSRPHFVCRLLLEKKYLVICSTSASCTFRLRLLSAYSIPSAGPL